MHNYDKCFIVNSKKMLKKIETQKTASLFVFTRCIIAYVK